MNDLLERWIAALRSGEYKQAKHAVCNDSLKGYCCLGVLQMVAEGEVERKEFGVPRSMPSPEFYERVGTVWDNVLGTGLTAGLLSLYNDEGHNFEDIADMLEQGAKERE